MQSYIHDHIAEPITLTQLARAAGYSPWYCGKIFKELTGKNPFDYIRSLRLSQAAVILRDQKERIIDVAFDFVFDSQEGFTKAFSRQFGVSPGKYRAKHPPIPLFMPYPVHHRSLLKPKGEFAMQENKKKETVFVQVIDRPKRKVLLKRGKKAEDYFAYCEELGCDIFGILSSVKEALYEPIGMWLPESLIRPGTSRYVQGVEVPSDYSNEIPEGYELIELPPCKMMVFQGEPYDEEAFQEAIADVWELMDRYDPSLYGFEWADDDAPRFQLQPMGYRGYIEARPVRPINRS